MDYKQNSRRSTPVPSACLCFGQKGAAPFLSFSRTADSLALRRADDQVVAEINVLAAFGS